MNNPYDVFTARLENEEAFIKYLGGKNRKRILGDSSDKMEHPIGRYLKGEFLDYSSVTVFVEWGYIELEYGSHAFSAQMPKWMENVYLAMESADFDMWTGTDIKEVL